MQLHDQTIVDAHACHFHQHVGGELSRVIGLGFPFERALEDGFGFRWSEFGSGRSQCGVVGGCRAHGFEVDAALFECLDE